MSGGYGKSVNPISTRRGRLCPPNYYWDPRIFRPSYGPVMLSSLPLLHLLFNALHSRLCALMCKCVYTYVSVRWTVEFLTRGYKVSLIFNSQNTAIYLKPNNCFNKTKLIFYLRVRNSTTQLTITDVVEVLRYHTIHSLFLFRISYYKVPSFFLNNFL